MSSTLNLCRKHGINDATFYNWRRKYGGMELADAKRLKALEAENTKLKKMLTEMDVPDAQRDAWKKLEALVRGGMPWTGQ